MSKAKQVSQAVATAKKLPKYVRRSIREDAIIWIPGEGIPDQLSQHMDNKLSEFLKEYDDTQKANIQRNYIVKAPLSSQDALSGMLNQISNLSPADQDRAIAAFFDHVINERVGKLKRLQIDEERVKTSVAKAEDSFYNMQKIQRGDFAIVTPVNYNQNGASVVSNDLVNKTDSGKAKD